MAEPEKQYEYGRTPEETAPGLKGFFNILRGPVVDAFTPERREVITAPETTREMVSDGRYGPKITPGEYGPVEKGLEYMPVVQAARGALDFAGKFATDGKVREETGAAIAKGIGQIFKDYQEGLTYGYRSGTDEMSFYDPEEKRVVEPDFLLPLFTGATGALLAPVKGPGMIAGMFAGPKAATANPKRFKLADEMAKKGRSREEIWQKTGLFRWERNGEPISDWRFEISDEQAKAFVNPDVLTPTGMFKKGKSPVVSDLFQHSELYKNYPGALTMGNVTNVAQDLLKVREATKKLQVEYGRGNLTEPQFRQQYNTLLEQRDQLQNLLKKGVLDKAKTSITGSKKVGPPFTKSTQRIQRPMSEIPLGTQKGGGAAYAPYTDSMSVDPAARPGQKSKYDYLPFDEQGRYIQPFKRGQFIEARTKATDDLKKAGLTLVADFEGGKTNKFKIQKVVPTGEPPYTKRTDINPETLPDYLKRQFDQLQESGTIFYKKDLDPTDRFRSYMLHELMHGIQHREGFEPGANPSEFRFASVKKPRTEKEENPTEIYMRTLGEMEARLVQSRSNLTDKERKEKFPWTREGGLDRDEDDIILRRDPGMPSFGRGQEDNIPVKSMTSAENLMKFSPRTTELSKEALSAFKNVSDTQRGRPELAMVKLQMEGSANELNGVVEHIGDLTHVLTNEAPYGSFRRDRVLGKIAGQINTLDKPDDVINNFLEQNYRSEAEFSKRDVNEVKEISERLLKQYAEEHKKVPVYNRPQFFAREAAVAVGEKRYSDAVDYLKKLRSIAEDPVAFQQAASTFIKPKLAEVSPDD